MAGIALIGERDYGSSFGLDSNEIRRQVYIYDDGTMNNLETCLNYLLGSYGSPGNSYSPAPCPNQPGFYCFSVNVKTVNNKSSQGSIDLINGADAGMIIQTFLLEGPEIKGGFILDICYRPVDYGSYSHAFINDETTDYSAQVMSVMANNIAQKNDKDYNPNVLAWEEDGAACSNLNSIIRIVPKVDIQQKHVFLKFAPSTDDVKKIGTINESAVHLTVSGSSMSGSGAIEKKLWPEGTLLLTGMPTIRRWRFDGHPSFETTIKLSAITLEDKCAPYGSDDIVTWNHLYRVTPSANGSAGWDKVLMPGKPGEVRDYLYKETDFSFLETYGL